MSYSSRDVMFIVFVTSVWRCWPDGARPQFFFAYRDFSSGTDWKSELALRIDQCAKFYLFWSQHSCTSPYVADELTHALSAANAKGLELPSFFRPFKLEPEDVAPLPEALKDHVQFASLEDLYREWLDHQRRADPWSKSAEPS